MKLLSVAALVTGLPCPSAAARKEIPETQGRQAANLTGIPVAQEQSNPSSSSSHPQAENSAVLFLPVTTSQRLSFNDKFTIYAHQTFGPPAVIFCVSQRYGMRIQKTTTLANVDTTISHTQSKE